MLRPDQEIFNILLEVVPEGVIIFDDAHHVIDANAKAESVFGYAKGELLQKELKRLIPLNFHKNYSTHFDALIKKASDRTLGKYRDFSGQKKNGDAITIELDLTPFILDHKSYLIALVEDVSEKRAIEKTLKLKSSALESTSNGIVITDALKHDNPIIYFNAAFQKLTGYSSEEILGHNCRFLQGKDRNQKPFKVIREAIDHRESCQIIVRNYKKDGSLFWNDLHITPIINSDGVLTNFIGIQNDVTLRISAESERNHFAGIFNESLNEIYVFDAKTLKFLNVNYGAQKNLGYTLKELLQKTPLDLKTEISEIEYRKILGLLVNKKLDKLEFETIHKRKDGTTYPVEVHVQLSSLEDNDVFVAIILDITESKNYTDELESKVEERTAQLNIALSKERELNELKTKFLSLVSHEFKTPLSGILTSSVLLGKYKLAEEQKQRDKHIKTISDKVSYLNAILNDFLSLEKLEAGKIAYHFGHFKLSKVVDEVIYNANMLLKEGQIIHYPDNINDLSLYQDERIVGLILANLVNNAIKYSFEHTTVSIVISQDENSTTIQVIDEGIGIPVKDQKSIYDLYFRAENVLNVNGTGIGLNIVKTHMENLGGTVSFESEESAGSTFTITIPNRAEE